MAADSNAFGVRRLAAEDAERNMLEAIQLHTEGMKEDGLPIPSSTATAESIEVGS